MKKLTFLLLAPFLMSGQCRWGTLLNVYPIGTAPSNYTAQPGPSNNNITQSNYGDSAIIVIKLEAGNTGPGCAWTPTDNVLIEMDNTSSPCQFSMTYVKTVSVANLTTISSSTIGTANIGYYSFKFTFSGFPACHDTSGFRHYDLGVAAATSDAYTSTIHFKILDPTIGIQELTKPIKIIKTESYNILGQPDENGFIQVIYYDNGEIKKRKEFR